MCAQENELSFAHLRPTFKTHRQQETPLTERGLVQNSGQGSSRLRGQYSAYSASELYY